MSIQKVLTMPQPTTNEAVKTSHLDTDSKISLVIFGIIVALILAGKAYFIGGVYGWIGLEAATVGLMIYMAAVIVYGEKQNDILLDKSKFSSSDTATQMKILELLHQKWVDAIIRKTSDIDLLLIELNQNRHLYPKVFWALRTCPKLNKEQLYWLLSLAENQEQARVIVQTLDQKGAEEYQYVVTKFLENTVKPINSGIIFNALASSWNKCYLTEEQQQQLALEQESRNQ